MLDSAAAIAELFDRAAPTYDRAVFPFFTPFGEALVEFAQLKGDERVLDAGCGSGAALVPAARVARDIVGVDISPAMAERARVAAPGAEVVVGDVSALPFEDASFDVVLSAFVIFFPEDPAAALREWARVLRPGGRVVMSSWEQGDPRWSWERQLRMQYVDQMDRDVVQQIAAGLQRIARFDSPEKVDAELRAAGLEPEAIQPHQIEFRFQDEQGWWDFNNSHAGRAGFDAMPETARDEFRERVFDNMRRRVRADDGTFPRSYTAVFATARRP